MPPNTPHNKLYPSKGNIGKLSVSKMINVHMWLSVLWLLAFSESLTFCTVVAYYVATTG